MPNVTTSSCLEIQGIVVCFGFEIEKLTPCENVLSRPTKFVFFSNVGTDKLTNLYMKYTTKQVYDSVGAENDTCQHVHDRLVVTVLENDNPEDWVKIMDVRNKGNEEGKNYN